MPEEAVEKFITRCKEGKRGGEGSLGARLWDRIENPTCEKWAEAMVAILQKSGEEFSEKILTDEEAATFFDEPELETVDLKGVEIFTSDGQETKALGYRNDHIDDMIRASQELQKFFEPAVTLGHPESHSGLPKLGIVRNLRKHASKAGTVVADFINVPKSLAPWIKKKLYDKVSAVVYKEVDAPNKKKYSRVIRSVGLLGAVPPRIKELEGLPVSFSGDGFSEFCKGGIEAVTFTKEEFNLKEEIAMPDKDKVVTISAEEHAELLKMREKAEKFAEVSEALSTLETQMKEKDNKIDELSESLKIATGKQQELIDSSRKAKIDSFIEDAKKSGRILPAQADSLREHAEQLDDSEKFGEGDAAKTPLESFIEVIMAIPEQQAVRFDELSRSGDESHDEDDDEETKKNLSPSMNDDWFKRAEKYAEEHKVDFETAAAATYRRGDEKHPSVDGE